MEINNKPISEYLINLATNLDAQEQIVLSQIIEILFDDIGLGHSCSRVSDILAQINISDDDLLNILSKCGLCGIYEETDFTILCTSPSQSNRLKQSVANISLNCNIKSGDSSNTQNFGVYPISYLKNAQLLFITKYLQYEISIARQIKNLKNNVGIGITKLAKDGLKHLEQQQQINNLPNIEQFEAIKNSLEQKLSIITGGPGTGKTTTIIFLLWLFYKNYGENIRIKLACPTGKAANRVQESIINGIKNPAIDLYEKVEEFAKQTNNFLTIHRLLGVKRNSIHFRHDENNPLDIDILIVDESSMVSLPMFSKLLKAVDPDKIKHIIFLGDKNQLSSVEEGYVFATLVEEESRAKPDTNGYDLFSVLYPKTVSKLNISKRNANEVGQLASAILANDKLNVTKILNTQSNVKLSDINFDEIIDIYVNNTSESYLTFIREMDSHLAQTCVHGNDNTQMNDKELNYPSCEFESSNYNTHYEEELYKYFYAAFTKQSILCVTNIGPYGTGQINNQVEKQLKSSLQTIDEWYTGRPILILENNYTYNLNNGDIGFCIKHNNAIVIIFSNGLELIPEALPSYSLAYALTIHKSQGSEYNNVNIVLNDNINLKSSNDLLSRELIYTAVTRAKNTVTIFGAEEVLLKSISINTQRNTGLKFLLDSK